MYQIKLRAWDRINKEFAYVVVPQGVHVIEAVVKPHAELEPWELWSGNVDNRGKEIFEGDVIAWGIERGTISFSQGSFGYYHPSKKRKHLCRRNLSTLVCDEDVEIIGNKHERPDLCSNI